MNLRVAALLIQVLGITSIKSILIPTTIKEDRSIVPKLGRASTWETVLKQAAFQSLTKYTGYTESLDEKIERDQILWQKVHGAQVERTGKQEGDPNVKSGTLLDNPSGNFEFRRGEKSLHVCLTAGCIDESKLLAIWKIQRVKPNHLVVRMKIPLKPQTEDTYQYTPSLGLKLQNSKELPRSQSTTYVPEIVEIPKKNKSILFPEQGRDYREYGNPYKGQQSQERPVTLYYVPTEKATPSRVIFPQTSNVLNSQELLSQHKTKDRYGLNSQTVKAILSEFQQETNYDGFLPSIGPTENPMHVFKTTPNQYKPDYKPNKATTPVRGSYKTYKQTTPANFKPSSHFVQYSEQDPIYYRQLSQTEKIPMNEHYIESKPPVKDFYLENSKIPVKETFLGGRHIKETYVDTSKFPVKGTYWDTGEFIPKELYVGTGKPFELPTTIKEQQQQVTVRFPTYTSPKESVQNYLTHRDTMQKYPIHHITTQEPNIKYTSHKTREQKQKYPIHITTEEPQEQYTILTSQKEIYRHPTRITTQEPGQKIPVHITPEASHRFPIRATTQEPIHKYPAVHTKSPELIEKYPVHATTPGTIVNRPSEVPKTSLDRNRIHAAASNHAVRKPPKHAAEHGFVPRYPTHTTESQETIAKTPIYIETKQVAERHPSSINEQLLRLDSSEREATTETVTQAQVKEEASEEMKEVTTEQPTTTTRTYTRKYKKGNRNVVVRNSGKNRTKSRGSTYFTRWGERVRNTSESPSYHRRHRVRVTTLPPTEAPPSSTEEQTEEIKEDSEVFESQTVSSIEIAPSELTHGEETTTLITTRKQEDPTTMATTKREEEQTTKREEELTTTTSETETTEDIETTTQPQQTTQIQQLGYRNKTPEEIVNELTALGLKNTSRPVEGTTQKPEASPLTQRPPDLITRLQAGHYDNLNIDDNETSLVVNRVSKSISFKTARGLSGRIMHPSNILVGF